MQVRKIRVLVVDDSRMMRDSLQQMISGEADMTVAAVAGDGLEALDRIRKEPADIILLDYYMPRGNAGVVIPQIKSRFPEMKILVFTSCIEPKEITQVFRLGAQGYLVKSSSVADIFSAIRRLYEGEVIIPTQSAAALVDEFRRNYASAFDLKPEETRIMHMIGDGLSSREVAYRLFIPEKEVNHVLKRFLDILQTELRAKAEEAGRNIN